MAVMASLAMAPAAALHRDPGAVESWVQLWRSSEFQCKVARPVSGRGNLSTSRVQQEAKFGGAGGGIGSKNGRGVRAAVAPSAIPGDAVKEGTKEYDAIVIGSGIGGLVAATQLH